MLACFMLILYSADVMYLRQLYADCMRCCIHVAVMLGYHVGNPGHMAMSYVAVGPICASSPDLDGNILIWNSTAYRALQLGGSRQRAWTRVVMGIDVFLFATRQLIVVCTQTCIFYCYIVSRQLYAACMRCCIFVYVML